MGWIAAWSIAVAAVNTCMRAFRAICNLEKPGVENTEIHWTATADRHLSRRVTRGHAPSEILPIVRYRRASTLRYRLEITHS